MTETHVTLYGDDSERFRKIKERLTERRDGAEPTNTEVVRLLMDDADL